MSSDGQVEHSGPAPWSLQGKTVFLTGASGYLGRELAQGCARAGATVIASSRSLDRAREVAESLPGPSHLGVALDYLVEESLDRAFEFAVDARSAIDVLINNGHQATVGDWKTLTPQQFRDELQLAAGYFQLARKMREHTVSREGTASIIMMGSMYGLVGSYPDVYEGLSPISPVSYHALKGGIIQMTRHLAVCWAADQVRVNCLCPGAFPNPERCSAEFVERLEARIPVGKVGRPVDLLGPALFLASDASAYVTGQSLVVDGGWTAW